LALPTSGGTVLIHPWYKAEKYGASYINDGVQGASPVFSNTFTMFEKLGFFSAEVGMQCSFGKGDEFWTNTFPSETIER
jgi:hypothetical protein